MRTIVTMFVLLLDRLPNLSPIVAKDFVGEYFKILSFQSPPIASDFYIATGKVHQLEKCLVHMRVKNLNIQKVSVYFLCTNKLSLYPSLIVFLSYSTIVLYV